MKSFEEFCNSYGCCDFCKFYFATKNVHECELLYAEALKNNGKIEIDISEEIWD